MGAKNMTREARDMELQWFDIRELTEDAAQTVIGMMDETRRRRVADIAGEDDRRRTVAGELLARRLLADPVSSFPKVWFLLLFSATCFGNTMIPNSLSQMT